LELDLKESYIGELNAPYSERSKGRPTGTVSSVVNCYPMAKIRSAGGYQDTEWTLILWDIGMHSEFGLSPVSCRLQRQLSSSRKML